MKLTPDAIQDLVTMAFCLEPLADKEGCTTRLVDLPEKSLTDFLVAGVNSGKYFRFLAEDIKKNHDASIFRHFIEALQHSNMYKSSKTVNFGLLEIMFPTVYARFTNEDPNKVISMIISIMQRENNSDVKNLIAARREAWKSSIQGNKKNFTGEGYENNLSPYAFYMQLLDSYPSETSSHQWAEEFKNGLPVLSQFFNSFVAGKSSPLEVAASVFRDVKIKRPDLKNGIIADMCAAALFLHYSYQ